MDRWRWWQETRLCSPTTSHGRRHMKHNRFHVFRMWASDCCDGCRACCSWVSPGAWWVAAMLSVCQNSVGRRKKMPLWCRRSRGSTTVGRRRARWSDEAAIENHGFILCLVAMGKGSSLIRASSCLFYPRVWLTRRSKAKRLFGAFAQNYRSNWRYLNTHYTS